MGFSKGEGRQLSPAWKEGSEEQTSQENFCQSEVEGKLLFKLAKLSQQLEKFNLAGYMNLLNNPRRYLLVNFISGLVRGFGIALGATIFGAFVLYLLQRLVVLNLPLIGDFIAEIVRIVLTYL